MGLCPAVCQPSATLTVHVRLAVEANTRQESGYVFTPSKTGRGYPSSILSRGDPGQARRHVEV
eukprot:364546-Chlamydomonas_euryale.AAC.14